MSGYNSQAGLQAVIYRQGTPAPVSSPSPVSGDHCVFLRPPAAPGSVEHRRCDDYADGTVTNCVTGEVIKRAPAGAKRGFRR